MTKFALMFAAAGMLLAAPNSTTQVNAEEYLAGAQMAQVSINVGGDRRGRRYHRDRRCETKVIYRHGRKTVIRNCR